MLWPAPKLAIPTQTFCIDAPQRSRFACHYVHHLPGCDNYLRPASLCPHRLLGYCVTFCQGCITTSDMPHVARIIFLGIALAEMCLLLQPIPFHIHHLPLSCLLLQPKGFIIGHLPSLFQSTLTV